MIQQFYLSHDRPIDFVVECSPMARETGVQSQIVIPKTQKVVLDISLLNTQHYNVRFKGKRLRHPLHLGVVAIEKGAFG